MPFRTLLLTLMTLFYFSVNASHFTYDPRNMPSQTKQNLIQRLIDETEQEIKLANERIEGKQKSINNNNEEIASRQKALDDIKNKPDLANDPNIQKIVQNIQYTLNTLKQYNFQLDRDINKEKAMLKILQSNLEKYKGSQK